MARRKTQEPQDEVVVVDEEGDYYPPANALAAFLEGFGGEPEYDGQLVEVSAYLPDIQMFECHATSALNIAGKGAWSLGEVVYVYVRELRALNKGTQKYIQATTETAVEMYDVEVYDIRDMLSLIDINVKAESVAKWNGKQRGLITRYAAAIHAQANDHRGVKIPPKPPELP